MPGSPVTATPGLFGKVSSLGDFVSRRLPPSFQTPWDRWLQQSMQASREQLGTGWLTTYLVSPIWRFALAAQVCDQTAWAGVLMPSVDRVGRHFPLTIATPLPAGTGLLDCLAQPAWYAQLEALALSTLEPEFRLERLEEALASLPWPAATGADETPPAACWRIAGADLPSVAQAIAKHTSIGHSLWWTDAAPGPDASLRLCRGLPPEEQFATMLAG